MDVRLSPEQVALRDAAAQLVGRLGPSAVGQLDDGERAARLDAAVTSAGWRELRDGDDRGEPWASAVDVAIVAEELGRGLADTAFVGPILTAELRRLVGGAPSTGPQTIAVDPSLGGLAVADGSHVPPGAFAVDARGARTALVLAPIGERFGLAEVRVGRSERTTDLTRPSASIAADAVVEPVADPSRALDATDLERVTALGLAITSADLVGVMAGAVRLATEYASARSQYGQAIGSFQAVQHLLADAHAQTEGSRSFTRYAAWAVDVCPPADALAVASSAKAYCARAARSVCETVIQVHGGIGNTWECLAHVYLRRALLSTDLFGGVDVNLGRVLAHSGIGAGRGLR